MKKIFTLLLAMTFSLSLFANLILKDGIYYQLSKEYTYPYRDVAVVSLEDAYSYFVYDTTSRYYTGDIIIPDTIEYESKRYVVTAFSDGLFCNCTKLRSVSIPATVTAIGNDVFVNCPALETINVDQNNPKYTLVDGILFNKTRDVLYCCPSKIAKSELSISDSVKVVLPYAFDNCVNLKKIDVGKVPLVCGCAFKNCTNLESVIFSAQVSLYDSYSFKEKYGWDEVCSLEYAMSQYAYEYPIFLGCSSLKNVEFKDLTVIPDAILKGCESVEEIIIPEGVTRIGYDAFNGCKSVKSFNIPSSVTELGYYAFDSCVNLSAIYYGGSIEQWVMLFDNAYGYANNNPLKYAHNLYVNSTLVTKVVLPEMETIPSYVFDGATCIDTIIISSNTHKIGDCAFANCTGLKHISFGKDLQSIGKFILANCNNLESVEWNVIRLSDPYLWQLYNWQGGVYEDYSSSFGYLRFEFDEYDFRQNIKSFIFGEEVEIIPDMLCEGLDIKEITIPRSVRQISSYAFASCSNLETIYWLATEYYDSEYPQYGIFSHGYEESNVSSIIFGDTIHYIPSYLCAGMTKLANIRMPLLADSIGRYAFACTGDMNKITIPAGVSKIGYGAFSGYITSSDYTWNMNQHHRIDTLVLPSTLISIDTMAFGDCEVANVMYNGTIGDWCHISFADYGSSPLEWIGGNWYCQGRLIEHLVIPDSILEIKRGAFCGFKNLKSLTLPDGLLTIGREAFANCNLDTIIIPNSVETIEDAAFIGSPTHPTYFELGSNVQYLGSQSIDAFPFNQSSVIKCLAPIPPSYSVYPILNGTLNKVTLYVPINSMKLYQEDEFWGQLDLHPMYDADTCSIAKGVVGSNVSWRITCDSMFILDGIGAMEEIGASNLIPWVKYQKIIKAGVVEEGITSLCMMTFLGCENMKTVQLPSTLKEINGMAFEGCKSLQEINIPDSVHLIGLEAFYGCSSISSIYIPAMVDSIGFVAFANCTNLQSIMVDENNPYYSSKNGVLFNKDQSKLDVYPMAGDSTYNIPETVNRIDEDAFWSCYTLKSITIPTSVTYIGSNAFYDCKTLTKIELPESVDTLGWGAFYMCTNIQELTLPSTLKLIGQQAFQLCSNINTITSKAIEPPIIEYGVFDDVPKTIPVYVPAASIAAYKAADGWKGFTNILPIGKNLENGYEYVDLGLSVKWARYNIGATQPEEYGNYFAWGETSPKTDYNWSTYKYCNESNTTLTKYCVSSDYGTIDNKTTLEAIDDAAHVCWGGNWRMPTKAEQEELINNCAISWTDNYEGTGVAGNIIRSNINGYTDKFIFLPFAGWGGGSGVNSVGTNGAYFSSSLNIENSDYAWKIDLNSTEVYISGGSRDFATPVRAVCQPSSTFDPDHPFNPDRYKISATASPVEGGTITGAGEYAKDSVAQLTAVANQGYSFIGWSDGNTDNPRTIAAIQDTTFIAIFTQEQSTNVIYYTASNKLPEVTTASYAGLHTNAFNVPIISHEFADGKGIITFADVIINVGKCAFARCSSLFSIALPNKVNIIGTGAFSGCSSLASIIIPNLVNNIDTSAFQGCTSLREVDIPQSVKNIGADAFYDCTSLTSVVIPQGVENIGERAFWSCTSLEVIDISNSVVNIGNATFWGCTALKSINVDSKNNQYSSIDGVLFTNKKDALIQYPVGRESSNYYIPRGVSLIRNNAFENSHLQSVTLSDNVSKVEGMAFAYCSSLTSITSKSVIPPSCDRFGCFYEVNKSIPVNVPYESVNAYKSSDVWKDFTNILSIAPPRYFVDTLYTCLGRPIQWHGRYIYDEGVYYDTIVNQFGCDSIIFKLELSTCPNYESNVIDSIWVTPGDTLVIGKGLPWQRFEYPLRDTFYYDTLQSMFGCDSIVLHYVFTQPLCLDAIICGRCGTKLVWELSQDSILTISGTGAMTSAPWNQYASSIKYIILEDGVTALIDSAFYGDYTNVLTFTCEATTPPVGAPYCFGGLSWSTLLIVPGWAFTAYNEAIYWKKFYNLVPLGQCSHSKICNTWGDNLTWNLDLNSSTLTIEGNGYMQDLGTLQSGSGVDELTKNSWSAFHNYIHKVIIEDGVTSIGGFAFNYNTNLEEVVLPSSLEYINHCAFNWCSNLRDVTLPNGLRWIGQQAFEGCTSMNHIVIPSTVDSIAGSAFSGCTNVTHVVLPDSVAFVGDGIFRFDQSIDSQWVYNSHTFAYLSENWMGAYSVPEGITKIAGGAMMGCKNLTELTLPRSLQTIEVGAFMDCSSLDSLVIPENVRFMASDAFFNLNNMQYIRMKSVIPPVIMEYTFEGFEDSFTFYVPNGTAADYKMSAYWNRFNFIEYGDEGCTTKTGMCGDGLTWTLTCDSVLTIYGSGAMYNYYNNELPWNDYLEQIKTIIIPEGLTYMYYYSFSNTPNLTTVYWNAVRHNNSFNDYPSWGKGCRQFIFGDKVKSIPSFICYGLDSLQTVVIPNNVDSIGNDAFSSCMSLPVEGGLRYADTYLIYHQDYLSSYTIKEGTRWIGNNAFNNCRDITSLTIPNSVENIGQGAFSFCPALTTITFGNSVISIGDYAFAWSNSLTSIICYAITPPMIGISCFDNNNKSIPVYVPAESVAAYKAADGWKEFTNIRAIGSDDCQDYYFVQDTTLCWGDTTLYWRGQWSYRSYDNYQTWTRNSEYSTRYYEDIDTLVDYHYTINGCDSVYYLAVHYKGAYISVRYDTIQQGETHWSGNSQTGIYYNHVYDIQGCDSIIYEIHLYVQPIQYYTITTAVNNTKYGSVEGAGTYLAGDTVILTATPKKGYQFTQWSDGNTDNPRHVAVTKDVTYTAQFAIKQCSWLVESSDLEMGAVYTDFTNEYYNYGTQITVEASPNSGYKFVKWNDGKKYNPYKFSLLEDKYLLAIFMADEEEMDTTTVQPADTTATFQWPFVEGGYTYTLTIYADQNYTKPICTLTFNQYGQLVSINFMYGAPKRHGTGTQPETFVCTVNGLEAGQEYYYKMQTTDEEGRLLNTDEGGFTTTQGGTPTILKEMQGGQKSKVESQKIMINGQLYILREGKTYNAQGGEL